MPLGIGELPDHQPLHHLVGVHHPLAAEALHLRQRGLDVRHLDVERDVAGVALPPAAGAASIDEPVTREWGGRSAYVADPERNRWEIAWAASATFDDRGAFTSFG